LYKPKILKTFWWFMLNVPRELTIAVSAQFESDLPNYHSDQWNLLVNIAGNILIPTTSTPQGRGWLTEIDGNDFADAVAGEYYWSARVISVETGEARSVGAGNLRLVDNLALVDEPYDGRTMAKKILDGLQKAIADLASGKISSYQIEGRGVTYRSLEELQKAEAYWYQRVKNEQAQIDRANGIRRSNTARARFSP
jgi:hypothetical protein